MGSDCANSCLRLICVLSLTEKTKIHNLMTFKLKSRRLLMTKQKSVKGLLIYFLIGIIALFFSILLGTIDKSDPIRANE